MIKHLLEHKYSSWIILLIYGVLLFTGIAFHEMWMDESHHWLVARESRTLTELFNNYKHDGHPLLWLLIMYFFSFVSEGSMYIQFLHGGIALASIALFINKAPFPIFFKIGFTLSYFPLYEYGVITRNYSILMLLLFCLPLYWKNYRKSIIQVCIILGLIANTHFFGLIFSVVLGGFLFIKTVISHQKEILNRVIGFIILGAMVLVSVYSILPPSDNPFILDTGQLISFSKIADSAMLLFKALVPIPDFTSLFFWNTNILTYRLKWFIAPFALLSWFIPFILRWRSRWLLLAWYLTSALVVMSFIVTQLHSGLRYGGVLVLFLITIKWMDNYESTFKQSSIHLVKISKFKNAILSCILIIQILSGFYHILSDIKRPFSATKGIYEFLNENEYQDLPIATNTFCNCISIRNYYSQPLYFLNLRDSLVFCEWNQLDKARGLDRQFDLDRSIDETMSYMVNMNLKKSILLYHGEGIFSESSEVFTKSSLLNVKHLATFKNGIVKRENYAVYLLQL